MSAAGATDPAAAAAQQAALLAAVQSAIGKVLSPLVVASFLSCALTGVLISLVVSYYASFPKDRPAFKVLVGVLTVFALLDTCNGTAWVYHWAVESFANPAELGVWPVSLTSYAFYTGPTVTIVQLFFCWRVWIVSGRTAYLLTGLASFIALGSSLYMGSWAAKQDSLLAFPGIAGVCYAWLGAGLGMGMWYYVLFKPGRITGGSEMVHSSPLARIVARSFTTGTVSLVLQLLVVILIVVSVGQGALYYSIPGFLECKIYPISVLVTLNARRSNSTALEGESHTHSASYSGARPSHSTGKGLFSRRSTAGVGDLTQNSIHVHIEKEVEVDQHERERDGSFAGSSMPPTPASHPYSVQFELADMSSDEEKIAHGNGRY
ncbi:hypothetical protein JCM8097_006288 [Rhodosporidiobolus ruineniae]